MNLSIASGKSEAPFLRIEIQGIVPEMVAVP
jgi:hypothetical protein